MTILKTKIERKSVSKVKTVAVENFPNTDES